MKRTKTAIIAAVTVLAAGNTGCSTFRSVFALDTNSGRQPPIQNPFGNEYVHNQGRENIVLRTKKGDRSIEVELPGDTANMTDFVVPTSPGFKDEGRSPASGEFGSEYKDRTPTMTDREITHNFPQALPEDLDARREVEEGLGVVQSEDSVPARDKSYLAALDHVKQLYKGARYEAALLEVDEMLRAYPTDPKLYTMRGTLLDRLGRTELALKSWNQALRFDPKNASLRRFVERKSEQRKLASP